MANPQMPQQLREYYARPDVQAYYAQPEYPAAPRVQDPLCGWRSQEQEVTTAKCNCR
jgi:hypothetical protein